MAKRVLWVISICLLFSTYSHGQQSSGRELGTIPDSLFAQGQYPADPEVPYLYSLKRVDVSFEEDDQSIVAVMKYHVRVKVFDASVPEAAVVGIPYYYANSIEQVSDIRGYTYQGPGQRVPLSTDNVRTININSRYNVKEFTMPAVQNGSVIEYAYTVRRRYIEELPDFYMAHQVPTALAEVSITYPKYLRYSGNVQNLTRPVRHSVSRIDTTTVPKIFTYPQPEPIVRETWRATDIPAVEKETYISSLDDYRGRIKFQLSEFGLPRQALENSWEYVVAEIRRKQQVTRYIDSNREAYALGSDIAAQFDDAGAVQDSIFKYLNGLVNYSGSKAPFSTTGDGTVLQGAPADQAAINQTLAAMLRGAGIDASPVLISTRESGRINPSFPSFFQFNGQLVHSRVDGQSYFMDASFPYSQPNLIPVEMYNQTGLLLEPESYSWVDIQPEGSAFSIDIDIDARLDRQGNLSGTMQARNSGYPARQIRQQQAAGASPAAVVKGAVLDGYPQARISGAEVINAGSYDTPTVLSAQFTIENYGVSFSEGIEFGPMIVGYLRENPFEAQQRNLPVTLDAPEQLDLTYTIELPQGMMPARPSQNRTTRLPGAMLQEEYNIEEGTLRYHFTIDISQRQFSTDLYPRLLDLYSRWVELSNTRWRLVR